MCARCFLYSSRPLTGTYLPLLSRDRAVYISARESLISFNCSTTSLNSWEGCIPYLSRASFISSNCFLLLSKVALSNLSPNLLLDVAVLELVPDDVVPGLDGFELTSAVAKTVVSIATFKTS